MEEGKPFRGVFRLQDAGRRAWVGFWERESWLRRWAMPICWRTKINDKER